ncbi:rhombosortase [Variovorax sp. UMC13]|uniref:rhombosortase n=1 Tax=Variovorax sp. UMC13 TaxID=1862326 RepID=UPI0021803BBD|nr:rhombosortase [Variovorax sp. UMC13]
MPEVTPGRAMAPAALAALLLVALQAAGDAPKLLLRYERYAVLHGELWRLFSAHLVHLGWAHALLNACGLLLCAWIAPTRFGARQLVCDGLLLGACVALMLLLFSPQVTHYVGLSGVLYGLFVLGLAPPAFRGDRIALLGLATVLGWMAWQLVAGPAPAEERQIGGRIIAVAHLYGVVGAFVLLAVQGLRLAPR